MATVKTAISVPAGLMSDVEKYAKAHGISRSEVFSRAVRQLVGHESGKRLTEVYDRVHGDAAVDAEQRTFARWSRASLAKIMEENPW